MSSQTRVKGMVIMKPPKLRMNVTPVSRAIMGRGLCSVGGKGIEGFASGEAGRRGSSSEGSSSESSSSGCQSWCPVPLKSSRGIYIVLVTVHRNGTTS